MKNLKIKVMNWDKLKYKYKQECTHELGVRGIFTEDVLSIPPLQAFDWIRKEVEKPIIGIRINHALTNKPELARELGLTMSQYNGRLRNFRKERFNKEETKLLIEIFLEYFDYVFDRGD